MMNEFAVIFYSLAAAGCWGIGDFSGGLAAKRNSAYSVVIVAHMLGVLILLVWAAFFDNGIPPAGAMIWGGLAGMFGGTGLMLLYHELSKGRMGVVAPVSGVVTVIVPVVVGVFSDGFPGILPVLGFCFALIAVWYVSRVDGGKIHFGELKLPILTGVEFGFFMIFMDRAGDFSILWSLVAARTASVSVLLVIAIFARKLRTPAVRQLPVIAMAGLFDMGGNGLFILATQSGRLDISAILSGLYPAVTVLLAWLLLKEKINRQQGLGVFFALLAIVAIAA